MANRLPDNINTGGVRSNPPTDSLARAVSDAIDAVYGPDYSFEARSGYASQPVRGSGGTKSGRHVYSKWGEASAADWKVYDPKGNQLAGRALEPLARHWTANYGSIGINSKPGNQGQNFTHLDLIQVKDLGPRQSVAWTYGNIPGLNLSEIKGVAGTGNLYATWANPSTALAQLGGPVTPNGLGFARPTERQPGTLANLWGRQDFAPPSPISPLGSSTMRRGRTQGPRVEALQKTLAALGYYDGPIDGKFGRGTKAAVETYQKATNLEVDGIVGPKTLSYLAPTYEQVVGSQITPNDPALDEFGVPRAVGRPAPYNPELGPPPANPFQRVAGSPVNMETAIPRANPLRTAAAPVTPVERAGLPDISPPPTPRMRPEIASLTGSVASQSGPITGATSMRPSPVGSPPVDARLSPAAEQELERARQVTAAMRAQRALRGQPSYGPDDYGTGAPLAATAGVPSEAEKRAAFEASPAMGQLQARVAEEQAIRARGSPIYDMAAYEQSVEMAKERARQELANALIGTDTQSLPVEAGTGGGVYNAQPQAGASTGQFLGGIRDFTDVARTITPAQLGATDAQNRLGNAFAGTYGRPTPRAGSYSWADISGPMNYSGSRGNDGLEAISAAIDSAASRRAAMSPRSYSDTEPRQTTAAERTATRTQNTRGRIAAGPSLPSYGADDYGSGAPISASRSVAASARPASRPADFAAPAEWGAGVGVPTNMTDLAAYGANMAASMPTAPTAPAPANVTVPVRPPAPTFVSPRRPMDIQRNAVTPQNLPGRLPDTSSWQSVDRVSSRPPPSQSGKQQGRMVSGRDSRGRETSSYVDSRGRTHTTTRIGDRDFYSNDRGGSSSSGKVLCTYYKDKGWLPKRIWIADGRDYQRRPGSQAQIMRLGYHAWAVPVVRWLQTQSRLAKVVERVLWPLIKAWAHEAAYRSGYLPTGTIGGKLARLILEPSAWLIGTVMTASKAAHERTA